jgi:hypothetical protein
MANNLPQTIFLHKNYLFHKFLKERFYASNRE